MLPTPARRVVVFTAHGCHLCEQALTVVDEAHARVPFELEVVDIASDPQLEAEYRTHIPVIEIDGVRAFTFFVTVDALLDRVQEDGSPPPRPGPAGSM